MAESPNPLLYQQLSKSTRWGLWGVEGSKRPEYVVTLSSGSTMSISPSDLEQIIADLDTSSDVDYPTLIDRLLRGGQLEKELGTDQLLRVRFTLLFATGEARVWAYDVNLRKQAIARTYPRSGGLGFYEHLMEATRDRLVRDLVHLLDRKKFEFGQESVVSLSARTTVGLSSENEQNENTSLFDETYVTEEYEGHRFEPDPGGTLRNTHRRTIRALRDGVNEFRQNMTFAWTGATELVHSVAGIGDISIENSRTYREGNAEGYQYELVVSFPPIAKGATRLVAWEVTSAVDEKYFVADDKMKIFGIAPRGYFNRAAVFIHFSEQRTPAELWQLTAMPREGVQAMRGASEFKLPGSSVAEASWELLVSGRLYGFRWRWASPMGPRDYNLADRLSVEP